MKLLTSALVSLVTGVAIGVAVSVLIPRVWNWRPQSTSATETAAVAETAEEFARRAVEAERNAKPEMADLLERAAFARAAAHGSEIPALWLVIRSQLDQGKQGAHARLESLQALRRAIDLSLSAASRFADFEAAWQVRVDVTSAIAMAQSNLGSEIEADLEHLTNEVKTEPFSKAALHFAERVHGGGEKSLDATMRILEAGGSPSATPVATRKANDIVDVMLPKAEEEKIRLEQSLDQQWKADQSSMEMEPEQVTKRGTYANLSEEIQQLHEDLKSMDLESWLVFATEPGHAGRLEKLYSDIARCLTRAQELQQAKYNLWAIREIHAAEEVQEGWPERLGRIDVRLIHPTVSALYSMAYETRMKSLDGQQRPQAVRRLIQQPKIAIEQF